MFGFLINCIRSVLRWIFGIRGDPVRQNHVVDVALFHEKPFKTVKDSVLLDEERNPHFHEKIYCPVVIGEILGTRYQVLGKLGWGSSSTVWFGRDTWAALPVALKVYACLKGVESEFQIYEHIRHVRSRSFHFGSCSVRGALDMFLLPGDGVHHWCLVQQPLLQNLNELQLGMASGRVDPRLCRYILKQVLSGLDFLHRKCRIIHTDIKHDNIMEAADHGQDVFQKFVRREMEYPSPRKFVDGHPVYVSRKFPTTSMFEQAMITDFGCAVRGDEAHNHFCGTDFWRAPEVMLRGDWSYPIDIWSVGVTAWILVQGNLLFHGNSLHDYLEGKSSIYRTKIHLAEIISLLGPPPARLFADADRVPDFFHPNGEFKFMDLVGEQRSFEMAETVFRAEEKALFLDFIRGMIQWRPEDRKTAKELLEDPWLNM